MELTYKNKKTEESILNNSAAIAKEQGMKLDASQSLLIKGDNITAMSLLQNQYKGSIDLIYIDPPFNTLQDFAYTQDRANSVSQSKNGCIAYSDKLSKEEYLEFLRERLILMRELMSERGSIYLHIDYKIGHYVKIIMDEVFGEKNFRNDIARVKCNPKNFFRKAYGNEKDLILFYTKSENNIWNDIKTPLENEEIIKRFPKIDENNRRYNTVPLHAPGETVNGATSQPWRGIPVPKGRHWRTNPQEFDKLDKEGNIEWSSTGNPRIKKYADEHKGKKFRIYGGLKTRKSPFIQPRKIKK